ncbi:hypothetical protein [Nocardia lijiangensis]
MADNAGAYMVEVGTVLVVTEGPRRVGYFHVTEVRDASASVHPATATPSA